MNILIVDDERYSVKAICECVHWNNLSEENVEVYKAYNSAQAKKIFAEKEISILICDVEMPRENGIELIRWLRENEKETEVIIITCHAEFEYAKEAISLGVSEYCVKPLDFVLLENHVRKLVEKIQKKRGELQKQVYGNYWVEGKAAFRNEFWRRLLNGTMTVEKIEEAVKKCGLPQADYELYLVLISIRKVNTSFVKWNQEKIRISLKNVVSDSFRGNMEGDGIIEWEDMILALFWENKGEDVRKKCKDLVATAKNMLSLNICCYISEGCQYMQVQEKIQELSSFAYGDVVHCDGVYHCSSDSSDKKEKIHIQIPKAVPEKLELGQFKAAEFEIKFWIDRSLKEMNIGREELEQIREDFVQMEYHYLLERGIEASAFEENENLRAMYQVSTESLENLKMWIENTLWTMENAINGKETTTPVEKIKRYIEENLAEELTREGIAEAVYMNADYMSRVFKRETGKSIMEYVGRRRIEKAVFFMQTTSCSVREIAEKTGFVNISHFSTAFKKAVGMSPSEFRRNLEKESEKSV